MKKILLAAFAVALLAAAAQGQTWYGPTPYVQASNSPFYGLSFSSFYLEDFEDGSLDTLGVLASGTGIYFPPAGGASTDSVDEDDGSIDGSGNDGRSLWARSIPGVTFTFNEGVLGSLPTHVGIVWTDGVGETTFEAFDRDGISLGTIGPVATGVFGQYGGQTDEDRFFGVSYTVGIGSINIKTGPAVLGIEVDHLQYGVEIGVIEVDIDIKPGSSPNSINQGSNGLIPVAIFSSAEFDATNVDPTTVELGGATVAVRGKGKSLAHEEDVDGDGILDLVVQVETTGFDTIGEDGIVILTGETFDGTLIEGSDEVVIVPPKK